MAGSGAVNILIILLQYTLTVLIYYFLYKVIKMINADINAPALVRQISEGQAEPSAAAAAVLRVIDAQGISMAHSSFYLGENVSIGRSEHNDIVIAEPFVSHEHACVTFHGKDYRLTDLGSTNGTFLNGQRITGDVILSNGSLIKIGSVTFKFER